MCPTALEIVDADGLEDCSVRKLAPSSAFGSRRFTACQDPCRWEAGKRQLIEGVIGQLKDFFLECHRASIRRSQSCPGLRWCVQRAGGYGYYSSPKIPSSDSPAPLRR